MGSLPRAAHAADEASLESDEKEPLKPIKGMPPSLIDLPSGCSFHPRCPYAKDICTAEVPPVKTISEGHTAQCHFAGEEGFTKEKMEAKVDFSEDIAIADFLTGGEA
jgi:oligopeptide/dipeptide ABC transporter ATP-binding protein